MFKFFLVFTVILLMSGCASEPLQLSSNAKKDYFKAKSLIEDNQVARAVVFLDKFSAKYPYSEYATKAELLRTEAAYLDEEYVLSETLALRFLKAHPRHPKRVRAQYLLAMSFYHESSGPTHDQSFTAKARDAFITLNQSFPNNPYQDEATRYIQELTDRLAEHELIVGKFYFNKKLYVAAANRLIQLKNDYPKSTRLDESLYYLTATYIALKQKTYAQETLQLLQEKFGENKWFTKAKALM